MEIFSSILNKLMPLMLIVLGAALCARFTRIQVKTLSTLLIYFIAPVVVFGSVLQNELRPNQLFLPLVFFGLCSITALLVLGLSRKRNDAPLLALCCASGNSGYFGLPAALFILGPESLLEVVLAGFGFMIFENTFGFYLAARNRFTAGEAFRKITRLPALYSFSLALLFQWMGLGRSADLVPFFDVFYGAYVVLGMSLLGIILASTSLKNLELPFVGRSLVYKFLLWPLLVSFVILADSRVFSSQLAKSYPLMVIFSMLPMAANSLAFAVELDLKKENAAISVALSTLLGLLLIPLSLTLLQGWGFL